MWIVRLALRRPYTVAVGAILIFLFGALSIRSMLVDIFPVIDIPVVAAVWNYPGMSAEDMERRVVWISERAYSSTVNGIERIESRSIPSTGVLRIYFQQGTDIGAAIAQISAVSNGLLRALPPGMTAPAIIQSNAANVPVVQLTLSSDTLSEEDIFDYALQFIRTKLFTIPGLSVPAPAGGKGKRINIDLDPARLSAKGLSALDVANALQASNLILPSGIARMGDYNYNVSLNSNVSVVDEFNALPVKVINNAVVTIGDVGHASEGFNDQQDMVRINGKRSAFLNILRKADASTLDVVNAVRKILPEIKAVAPKGLDMRLDFDQSVFVTSAITSVVREALIATLLVSLMVFFFLGSWRSTIVICTSIPLAISSALIALKMTGNSINIMTLGGLSLAIGMLVDDAIVEVENIHRNRDLGKPLTVAILTSAHQVALPAIMATLSIAIVFFPVIFLTGPAQFLFTPMALAVVFAMMASYLLSRTLVPQFSRTLMASEEVGKETRFTRFYDRFQDRYDGVLGLFLEHRSFVLKTALVFCIISSSLVFFVGRDVFPVTDTGLMKLHFRAPAGTHIDATEAYVAKVEDAIRKIVPKDELQTINSMIGLPTFYNLAYGRTENAAPMDAEILIALKPGHAPTARYIKAIRTALNHDFPGCTIYFQAADIVSQVLNFNSSAPIDIQFEGRNSEYAFALAKQLKERIQLIPGLVDVNIKQVFDMPTLSLDVDRNKAARLGLNQRDISNNMLISLASNVLVSPSIFLDPRNDVSYTVAVKIPLREIRSVDDLLATTITPQSGGIISSALPSQRLGNLVSLKTTTTINGMNHNNVQRTINMTANVENRDLGSAVAEIRKNIAKLGQLNPGTTITIRGQNEVMDESFFKLGAGLLVALLLVYLLMVVLFQSWLDPFIVLVAIPGSFMGILWMLALTGTTLNLESLMGSIMSIGIAASNSILLVSFANDARVEKGMSAIQAALYAGKLRLRPVLMTAFAMTLGMLPAALGLGEGGEQIAPLGRAVIGGLMIATLVTLFIVPIVYSLLRTELPSKHLLDERLKTEESLERG